MGLTGTEVAELRKIRRSCYCSGFFLFIGANLLNPGKRGHALLATNETLCLAN